MRGTPNGTQLVDALETFLKRYLVLAPGLPFRGLEARLHGIVSPLRKDHPRVRAVVRETEEDEAEHAKLYPWRGLFG